MPTGTHWNTGAVWIPSWWTSHRDWCTTEERAASLTPFRCGTMTRESKEPSSFLMTFILRTRHLSHSLPQNLLTRTHWTASEPGWQLTRQISRAAPDLPAQNLRWTGPPTANAFSGVRQLYQPSARGTLLLFTPSLKHAWTRAPGVRATRSLIRSADAMGEPTPTPVQPLKPMRVWNTSGPANNPGAAVIPIVVMRNIAFRRRAVTHPGYAVKRR